jgi:hypothetical protein
MRLLTALVGATVLALGGVAMADTTTVVLPTGLSNASDSIVGWDADKAAPGAAAGAPIGFGDSSMYVSVANNDYRTLRVYMQNLFGAPVTLGQLQSLSYDTFGDDAYAIIYTSGTSAHSSWYSGRFMALATNVTNPNWQTNASGDGSLTFYNTTDGLSNPPVIGFSDLRQANTNPIMFIDFKIGAGLNPIGPQTGQLDALSFTVNGVTKTLDLSATEANPSTDPPVVPLPAAAWSGMALLAMLGVASLRRKTRQIA